MPMTHLTQERFTRQNNPRVGGRVLFTAEASDLELGAMPQLLTLEDNNGQPQVFKRYETLRDGTPDNEVYAWTFISQRWGKSVEVKIFND